MYGTRAWTTVGLPEAKTQISDGARHETLKPQKDLRSEYTLRHRTKYSNGKSSSNQNGVEEEKNDAKISFYNDYI